MQRKILKVIQTFSLRRRIVYLFAIAALIPFLSSVILSYNAIYSILDSKLETSAKNTLKHTELSLYHTMENLAQTSQQLVYPSSIAIKFNEFLQTDDKSKLTSLEEDIQKELDYITYTNASAGLAVYIAENDDHLYRNMLVRDDFSIDKLPSIGEFNDITYYGPHISNNPLNTQYVISITRDIELPNNRTITLYLESSFSITKNILSINQEMNNSFYLILDKTGRIAFSELSSAFPRNDNFHSLVSTDMSGKNEGYYWFKSTNVQGCSIVSLIPQKQFDHEKDRWISQMVFLAIIFGIFSLLISWLVWKMVYKPIRIFDSEIEEISNNNLESNTITTKIPEFDHTLNQLQNMKIQIGELLTEVEWKEKKRADLEIEKLMYQINPHFLMNTLDTVHWLAVIHKQDEIDKMVSALNKLLYYNLKRSGKLSTVREELDSLTQYFTLQEIRYDFTYTIVLNVHDSLLNTKVPRFILQPIAENSIQHGLEEDGHIVVTVYEENNQLVISIKDNGSGLSQIEIDQLMNNKSKDKGTGIGIGLNYVKRMLHSYYGEEARIRLESERGEGTVVQLIIPKSF
ncbi:sensor histidine kinase [Saliterribacillus persicus]|uniref:histidine kinase n=1 Tax=Saliterribacillus persicus TaxID=930114 RepID=A0A368YBG6_9BACI|nr:histidine kinase [Saliterribacillus persicus]RCW77542.1 two-component system sensor histidine kinase YesM [Saliterribacillus persicus]